MTRKRDPILGKAISSKIKALRQKLYPGVGGQTKCAEAFGAKQGKWSKWESGLSVPTDPEQRNLARFFGITMAELRGEKLPPAVAGGKSEVTINELALEATRVLDETQSDLNQLRRLFLEGQITDKDFLEAVRAVNASVETALQEMNDSDRQSLTGS